MDLPTYISPNDFTEEIEQIEEMVGPEARFPLPSVVQIEPGRQGPRVTVTWADRRYVLRWTKADDGGDEVAVDLIDASETRPVLRQDEVVGVPEDLPFDEPWGVYAVAWRVWERADAARDALLSEHAEQVVQALNAAIPLGFARFAQE